MNIQINNAFMNSSQLSSKCYHVMLGKPQCISFSFRMGLENGGRQMVYGPQSKLQP